MIVICAIVAPRRIFVLKLWVTAMLVTMVMPPVLLHVILIPSITITELVIQKPSSNPVGTVLGGSGKIPIITRILVSTSSNSGHCFILEFLLDVAPVVWRFTLAITL